MVVLCTYINQRAAVANFNESRGNLCVQCIAAMAYKKNENFLLSNGILQSNTSSSLDYLELNIPFSQFQVTINIKGCMLQ
eukprot:5423085-Ditylum_brightwellii.AAC.1